MLYNDLISAQRAAKGRDMSVLDLVGSADALKATCTEAQIADLYRTWIAHNGDNPLLYAVLFNLSAVLTEMGTLDEARECLERSLAINPDFAPSHINLGRLHERMGAPNKSVAEWASAIDRLSAITGMNITHKTTALNQMARVLEANNQDEAAENTLRQSLEIDVTQREVAQHYLAARQRLCKWPLIEPWERVTRADLMRGLSPLSMSVFTDDPMLQLACNWNYCLSDCSVAEESVSTDYWAATEARQGAPLRIGYVSSDLREHAIGFLMAELFELHNRVHVESFVYYCGVVPDDPMMRRIKETVDHWIPITQMDDAAAAERIRDDGIQILVDVNAYTRDGRIKLFAMRPAPVIVNWLGFPGSTGSPYHHYIIADEWIVPPENEKYFSEQVLRLPCYQPNDRKRNVANRVPTRAECGLPDEAMVYCCFNGTQKIARPTFDRWLSILQRVPNSVLWLLSGTADAHERLRVYAEARGVARERLIFADKKPNAEHLARYPLADLFLDTSPYGAHTTASDALWMGVPVLTLNGRSFASRVCGSLVRAAGLPEMACATAKEYVDRAVALGKDKSALLRYREKLAAGRDTCDLFNTQKLVEELEGLYRTMWQTYLSGALPTPDLRQLGVYLEVGLKRDHDAEEVQTAPDYEGWWKEALAKRHKVRPLYPDNRLWKGEA